MLFFTVMLCGLKSKWRQLIGYHFTGKSFDSEAVAEWIIELLSLTKSIKLSVSNITMDMSPLNRGI